MIRWGFYLLFGLVPILLTPWNYELFEFNKMMAVYALTVLITGAWLVKSVQQGEFRIARTPLDIPIAVFVTSQFVSSLFSMDPHVSWFGYYSRFNGGMLSIISYVLLYYALVSNGSDGTHESYGSNVAKLLKISMVTGAVVALYGVAERLGIDRHLWVQDVQNRVFSTLGQPNWLAAYLVALAPLAMALGLQNINPKHEARNSKQILNSNTKNSKRFGFRIWNFDIVSDFGFRIWSLIAALFFLVLLFTRSRSGLLGFAVADVVFWSLLLIGLFRRSLSNQSLALKSVYLPFFLFHIAFVLIVFFNGTAIASVDRWMTLEGWRTGISNGVSGSTVQRVSEATVSATYTAPLLETGGTESGTIRKYVWQGAINAWRSSLKTYLIGTGTETFAFAFYQFRPKEHNLTSEWDFLYNKAHNEYLNFLATTGVFGLGSYLLLIGVFVVWFIKSQILNLNVQQGTKILNWSLRFGSWDLNTALFSGWFSVLVTNFFGFSVVIVQVFLFLFPAVIFVLSHESRIRNQEWYRVSLQIKKHFVSSVSILVVLVLLALLVLLYLGWYADTLYAGGYRASRAGQYDVAVDKLSRAQALNPFEPLFTDELGSGLAGLVTAAIEAKDATHAASLVKRSLASSDRAISTSPSNVNFWKTRTKIYYTFSGFDAAFNDAAIEALRRARTLSPNDPKISYNLAILYGRKSANDTAIEELKKTIDLKPNYRDAYYALWVFYTEIKKSDLAQDVLKEYLAKVDPGDKDFLEKVKQRKLL
ncbi:O-antigen ligase family protein [Candidatus Gottesmanbacteria bacterium]|nr:O-antigen ligase family protein [Candidatus Gottesmanbacteria bacterium]